MCFTGPLTIILLLSFCVSLTPACCSLVECWCLQQLQFMLPESLAGGKQWETTGTNPVLQIWVQIVKAIVRHPQKNQCLRDKTERPQSCCACHLPQEGQQELVQPLPWGPGWSAPQCWASPGSTGKRLPASQQCHNMTWRLEKQSEAGILFVWAKPPAANLQAF